MSSARSLTTASPKPVALRWYVRSVGACGFLILALSIASLPFTPHPLAWIAVGAVALITGSFALKVPGLAVRLSISDTFYITSALLFGPAPATVTIALDSLLMSWRMKQRPARLVFNTTSTAISLWAATQAFYLLAQTAPLYDATTDPRSLVLPLACLAGLYFALNSGLTVAAISLEKGVAPIALWRQHFAIMSLNHFAAASASFFMIVVGQMVGVSAIAAVVPLLVIFYLAMQSWLGRVNDAQEHVATVNRLYLSTIGALSTAIEAKDGVTSDHIHRVQTYALGLARALDITDEETVKAIEAAALLHDTGKLAVPEHILNKPGKLTAAEFEKMKLHVDVGADILSSIDFPYPVVPIVRCHHENWDGTGYPRGVAGRDIPIGARILSVVDCFDALTSDRPYRRAMTAEDALKIILERSGTMYDPDVVNMFVRVHHEIAPTGQPTAQLQQALGHIKRAAAGESVSRAVEPAAAGGDRASQDTSEDLLAFVSLARLASGPASLYDVGSLAWGQLRHLMPGATLALFGVDTARNVVVAEFVSGPRSATLNGLTMTVGDRLSGWVAAHARSIANSDARLDLLDHDAENLRFCLAVPLQAAGSVVGVLTLYAPEMFGVDEQRMLEMIAPHLAASVVAVRANREAETAPAPRPRPARADLRVVASR